MTLPVDGIETRRAVIDAANRLHATGLTRNTSGNIGLRLSDGFLVTPTGMPYAALEPEDIVHVDWQGQPSGRRLPSSEWRFHRDLFISRPEAGAVLHAHPPFATSLACLQRGIPSFHYMVAMLGGADIRCGDYATFGTEALSRNALAALDGRKACLLANHGIIVLGCDIEDAFRLAIELETLAEMYWRALQAGEPVLLDDREMALVVEKFKTYGQQPSLG